MLSLFDRHRPVDASVWEMNSIKCSCDNVQCAGPEGEYYAEEDV